MPTADPFHAALAKFYEQEMTGAAKRARRMEEALVAALEGQDGFDDQGRLIIDTDRMARASLAGHKIKAEADGARMVFSVVDEDGKPVPIQARPIGGAVSHPLQQPTTTTNTTTRAGRSGSDIDPKAGAAGI